MKYDRVTVSLPRAVQTAMIREQATAPYGPADDDHAECVECRHRAVNNEEADGENGGDDRVGDLARAESPGAFPCQPSARYLPMSRARGGSTGAGRG